MSKKEYLEKLFAEYPDAKQFYLTSDLQAFTEETNAKNHAKTLENKEVELVKRPSNAKAEAKSESTTEGTVQVKGKKKNAKTEEATKEPAKPEPTTETEEAEGEDEDEEEEE